MVISKKLKRKLLSRAGLEPATSGDVTRQYSRNFPFFRKQGLNFNPTNHQLGNQDAKSSMKIIWKSG